MWFFLLGVKNKKHTLPKTNMDTQKDSLEKATPFEHGNCWILLVSMLDLWGVRMRDKNEIFSPNHLSLTESISNHIILMMFVTNFLSGFFPSWPFLAK